MPISTGIQTLIPVMLGVWFFVIGATLSLQSLGYKDIIDKTIMLLVLITVISTVMVIL